MLQISYFWHKSKLIVKTISTLIKTWQYKFYHNSFNNLPAVVVDEVGH